MAEGQGRYLSSKLEAINEVRELQARGIRNIDVGCMQVNLYHHPDAFFSLEQAFDPAANVTYAAQFLRSLYRRHRLLAGGGRPCIIRRRPSTKIPYHDRVVRIWNEQQRLASAGVSDFGVGPLTAGLDIGRGSRPYPFAGDALLLCRTPSQRAAAVLAPGMRAGMEALRQPSAPDNSARLVAPSQARSPVTLRTLDEEAAFAIRRAQYLQELRRAVADVKRTYAVRGLNDGRQEAENGSIR